MEEADYWPRGLLREYGERPYRSRGGDCFDEIASSHSLTPRAGLRRLRLATSRLHQGFPTGEMGFTEQLHSSKFGLLTSALGQKRT